MASSLFSKIVAREIPAHIVAENEHCLAFLDVFPLAEGHTLVVPKTEVDYLFDLDDDHYEELMVFSRKVAKAIHAAVPCRKVGLSVVGLEVPHAHVHLIPLQTIGDMNFAKEKQRANDSQLAEVALRIQQYL